MTTYKVYTMKYSAYGFKMEPKEFSTEEEVKEYILQLKSSGYDDMVKITRETTTAFGSCTTALDFLTYLFNGKALK